MLNLTKLKDGSYVDRDGNEYVYDEGYFFDLDSNLSWSESEVEITDESGRKIDISKINTYISQGTETLSLVNNIFSMFNGGNGFLPQNNNNAQLSPQQQEEARRRAEEARRRAEEEERKRNQNNSNTLKYVGIGVAVVTIGGLIVWAVSRSNSDKK